MIAMKCLDQASPQRWRIDSWVPGLGEGRMGSDCWWIWGFFLR